MKLNFPNFEGLPDGFWIDLTVTVCSFFVVLEMF